MSFGQFFKDQSGAVTVDWVVLTAATVGMGLATLAVISTGVENSANNIDAHLTAPSVVTRMYNGFGYEPHDSGQFRALLLDVAALPEADLQQMAAYSNQINGMIDDETDSDVVGRAADFNVAVDMAYANAGLTRYDGTDYDEAELTRISADMGFDAQAMTGDT